MNSRSIGQIAFVAVASLFAYAFVAVAKDGESRRACSALCAVRPHYAAFERKAPDFELPNLRGEKVKLSSFRGKVVLLNFWSKTCPPCLEEMPSLAELAHKLEARKDKDIVLLTITTDESAEDARQVLQSLFTEENPFEVLVDPDGLIVGDKFGTKLYPETWYIDPAGVIRARVDGGRNWAAPELLELAESLKSPLTCPISFKSGKPGGPLGELCGEMGRR